MVAAAEMSEISTPRPGSVEPPLAESASTAPPPTCLKIALPLPVYSHFDYLPPVNTDIAAAPPGTRLEVPFGRRRLTGIVMQHGPCELADPSRLKPACRALDATPAVPAATLQLINWAARYYQHPPGDALFTLLPPAFRTTRELRIATPPRWQATPLPEPDLLRRSPRQAALHDWLLDNGPAGSRETSAAGFADSLLRALRDRDLVRECATAEPGQPPLHPDVQLRSELTAEQASVLAEFRGQEPGYRVGLLQGVTGSGKTEVYLQIIAQVLAAGRQAILLVPEISLTPQTLQRVRSAFGADRVAELHSGLGEGDRLRAWLGMRDGSRQVLVGARSAILTPMCNPGLIIVDEEHDASFKQQEGFRYSARDLAVKRGQTENIPVLLGSATPSLESLLNARDGRYQLLRLASRAHGRPAPAIELLDIRQQALQAGMSEALRVRVRSHLQADGQVLLFQNRRGFAPVLVCDNCGYSAECAQCDMRMTVHLQARQLRCHHCDRQVPLPQSCPSCQHAALTMLGAGTQRISAHLEACFPEYPVIRVDRDSVRSARQHSDVSARIRGGGAAILVGTQMLAKGHDFPNLTLVAMLDADCGLLSSDFRGLERTGQLIIQVAGRTGRADRHGEVILQTRQPEHPALQVLARQGYEAFARIALDQRQSAALPPFTALAAIHAESGDAQTAMQALTQISTQLQPLVQDVDGLETWGPSPSPMPRRAGRHRAQLILSGKQRSSLQKILPTVTSLVASAGNGRKVRWAIDVDPMDLY